MADQQHEVPSTARPNESEGEGADDALGIAITVAVTARPPRSGACNLSATALRTSTSARSSGAGLVAGSTPGRVLPRGGWIPANGGRIRFKRWPG
jgi:hypothetical protein